LLWVDFQWGEVDFEDLLSGFEVWEGDFDDAIESSWSCECVIEGLLAVGCGEDNYGFVACEAVHFD
jgi:hypothetical protein